LLVYHFMFGPDYTAGCPTRSTIADGFNGFAIHLANHDVMLWAVSRAPLAKLQAYKRRMGWSFPWASSFGSDFNYDFNVSFTEEQQQSGVVEYNFHAMDTRSDLSDPQTLAVYGTDAATTTREAPGMSAFALEDGVAYTPTRRTRAGWTPSGACISGSTARHWGATRRSCEDLVTSEVPAGSVAATNTRASDACGTPRHR
jgi:predicted dithiol-disulfide oxidoreductase (DUF899 family)